MRHLVCFLVYFHRQVDGGHRRLMSSTGTSSLALTIKASYTGAPTGADSLAQRMDSDVCSITGICAHLRDVAVKRRWLQAEPLFKTGSLDMVITSSSQGNWTEVEVTATYKEEGLSN
jgi:hypothetical protein